MKKTDIKYRLRLTLDSLKHPLVASIFGLLIGALVILISRENPILIYRDMFQKSFFKPYYLLQTLTRSTPIIICGIAIATAWRAGYINLGVEGQMITGGFVATTLALYLPGPPKLVMILAIIGGMVAGGLYANIAAFLNLKYKVSLVISTLMMNYIANYITTYFISYPMRDRSGDGLSIQSEKIVESMQFLKLWPKSTLNLGFIIAIFMVLAFIFVAKKTVFGYESKMTGLNPNFASYGGIRDKNIMLKTMALSGAIGALAGITEIFGVKHRFLESMFVSTSYAWTGLMAALMANLNPIGIFFSSIFLSGLQVGGQSIQRSSNVPLHMATVIQACITLFVSVKISFGSLRKEKTCIREDESGGGI